MTKSLRNKLIALAALITLMGILLMLKTNQAVCEFFATTFSRWWIFLFGNLFGWLPFSVYEVFLIVTILSLVAFVVVEIYFLAKRKWARCLSFLLTLAFVVIGFVNVYTATASFAYGRNKLPSQIYTEYSPDQMDYAQALQIAQTVVDEVNYAYQNTEHDQNGNIVFPFTFEELSDLLKEEYKRLDCDYLSSYTPTGKRVANKRIMSEMHIVGVFFAPFGEANVNGNENNLYLPLTLAHEMAHGKGVMREYDANNVSYYLLLTSDNPYLRYGALVRVLQSSLSLASRYPNSKQDVQNLRAKIHPGINVELKNYSEFYAQFTLMQDVGNFFNDIYLKLQNQSGTDSYVKPGIQTDTGKKDDFGEPIYEIKNFSNTHNLLIHLYKQNLLAKS